MSPDTKSQKILPPYPYAHRYGHEGRKAPGHSLFELLIPNLWNEDKRPAISRTAEEYLSAFAETGLAVKRHEWLSDHSSNDFYHIGDLEGLTDDEMNAWRIWGAARGVMTAQQAANVDWVLIDNVQPRSLAWLREGMTQLAYYYRCIQPPEGWVPRRRIGLKALYDEIWRKTVRYCDAE